MEKIYKYFTGHNKNIQKLETAVGQYRHAIVLDKFAFLSINSNFILFDRPKDSGWFCIEYKDLAKMTGYKERTMKAIVKSFEKAGFIEKIRKIVNNNCRACIRITEKTKAILNISGLCGKQPQIIVRTAEKQLQSQEDIKKLDDKCTLEGAKNAPAYKEEKKNTESINIITHSSCEKKQEQLYNVPKDVQRIFDDVGERLPIEHKAVIWGAINNFKSQSGKSISNPAEFVAWMIFSILNAKHQLKGAETFHQQVNTILKIARSPEGFKKPRGFHNHWDIGEALKEKENVAMRIHQQQKMGRKSESREGIVFEARKVREIHSDNANTRKLKAKRAGVLSQINGVISDTKILPQLFANNIPMQKIQLENNGEKTRLLKQEMRDIDAEIASISSKAEETAGMQWEGLYEAR